MSKSGIYFLINKQIDFVYIHHTKDLELAYNSVRRKLQLKTHRNILLQTYWDNLGEESFVFVQQNLDDEEKLKPRVIKWVDYFRNSGIECSHNINELVKNEWEIDRIRDCEFEDLWVAKVDLRAKMFEIKLFLDYDLEFADTRKSLVYYVLNNNKWLVDYVNSKGFINKQVKNKNHSLSEKDMFCAFLSNKLADYLVFPKYKTHKQKLRKIYIMNKYKEKRNRIRELLVDDFTAVNENKIVKNPYKVRRREDNYKLVPKQTITQKDRVEFKELDEYQKLLDHLTKNLGKTKGITKAEREAARNHIEQQYGKDYLNLLDRIYNELQNDIPYIKDSIRRTIYFKRLCNDSTEYNFDNDTGYFNDKIVNGRIEYGDYVTVSENKIELSNPDHVFAIIDNYSSLRESCYENPDSDLWAILHDFDELVEKSPLEDYVKDILIMKIDGMSGKEICEELQVTSNTEFTEDKISYIYKNTIPKMIASTYEELYEEWFYTFKVKGQYKTCSSCKDAKLLTQRHFGKNNATKHGYQSVCKVCDNLRKTSEN